MVGVTTVALIERKLAISRDLFTRYWRDVHGVMAARIPGFETYTQYHVTPMAGDEPFEGIAIVTYASEEDRQGLANSAVTPHIHRDEQNVFRRALLYNLDAAALRTSGDGDRRLGPARFFAIPAGGDPEQVRDRIAASNPAFCDSYDLTSGDPAGWNATDTDDGGGGRRFMAVIHAGCARCDWGEPGREAVGLRLSVDGTYSQHLFLSRGEAPVDYRVRLGTLAPGWHQLRVERDAEMSARAAGPATIDVTAVDALAQDMSDDVTAQSRAPILYARPNTVGAFTDLPLLMWYEVEPTPRGRQFRYSVIFSNEDGGTATDRLMATWGRTTDIEFVYGVEVDAAGQILAEEFQGPGHEVPAFKGQHEGRHPLLWVSTDNNMVSESGPTRIRYAPEAVRFDLANVSREAVMDANPWTYAIASVEMRREGKVADDAPPGNNTISDPRRFVYVEACGQIGNAALALSIRAGDQWIPSDRGMPQYRIVRDGCFRVATPLPAGARASSIRALRVQAFERPPAEGAPPAAPDPVHLTRINKVFMLDEHDLPGASILKWQGAQTIRAGGDPFEVRIP